MYSSHSYPYAFNQSPHQTPPSHTPPQPYMPMPSHSQPNLSYPHPSPAPPSYPTPPTSATSSPAASMTAVGGTPGASRGSSEFPLLTHLSVDELQRLLAAEDKLNDIADDANQNKQRRVDKEMAMAENRSLADFNLSRETRLREGRNQLARLHEEAKRIREIYDVDRRRLESLNENYSLDAAKVMLETSATKTEEESEEIAEEFLNGNLPLSDFVEQFIQRRSMAHIRRIKSDKMQELLRNSSSTNPPAAQNVDIPMTTPMGYTPMPTRPAPAAPPATGSQIPMYYPGYSSHTPAPVPAPVAASGSSWSPYQGSSSTPSLPVYPR
ncbi:vacuolar protein sorting-associated protein 37B-like isoform X2 [Lytechinus variegatus]|nr:vacuolar protein sorting-associated protein 37B-like isoform X2 [Lytechinus variegatus]XP_041456456.1 vacuolar protein sorting-associated protein 37B-like isoform X2 [Lytechinus variegatus]XP_041456457.1 vacuolar protein sorting-associated protein 37B-like isoform X2 [Lytechinus variegatus]